MNVPHQLLAQRAGPDVHDRCFELVESVVPAGARVLDIAAGTGAFTARLRDAGYRVTANDLDRSGWGLDPDDLLSVDLNGDDLSALGTGYDAVVAMEIIEHLENPTRFLRTCGSLLAPGGVIVLSTPNTSDRLSRTLFLRSGITYHFTPWSYRDTGHMVVLPPWLLELLVERAGLRVEERQGVAGLSRPVGLKTRLLHAVSRLLSVAMRPDRMWRRRQLESQVLIYLLTR